MEEEGFAISEKGMAALEEWENCIRQAANDGASYVPNCERTICKDICPRYLRLHGGIEAQILKLKGP